MAKKRTNVYLTERQIESLSRISQQDHLSTAETIRRAIDAYLAWVDPEYQPERMQKASRGGITHEH